MGGEFRVSSWSAQGKDSEAEDSAVGASKSMRLFSFLFCIHHHVILLSSVLHSDILVIAHSCISSLARLVFYMLKLAFFLDAHVKFYYSIALIVSEFVELYLFLLWTITRS